MPAKQGMTFQTIMNDLKARKFSPIYILMGDESYYIDRISTYIAENVLNESEKDFNLTVCFGADINAAQVTDMARRFPMMAKYQVIIVKEAQNVRSLDALEKYLRKPVDSTILVWCHKNGTINVRKKIISLAQAVGVVFESKKLRDYQLADFIQKYVNNKNISIDAKSCGMIADSVGADLNRLTSELDKVIISLPEIDKRITPERVEREVGVSKEFNSFELRNALIRKDVFKANQIMNYFDKNPKAGSLFSFLPLLFSFFQNLMIVHYLPLIKSENNIANALKLRSAWSAKDYIIGLRNYTPRKTMEIISKFREIDAKSKGIGNPNISTGDLMKELIFFILH